MQTPHSEPDLCASKKQPSPIHLLIVDDNSSTAEMSRIYFENIGYKAEIAETLGAARKELARKLPNAVLLDINLPDGNGLDFLGEFKKLHPHIPAVIFTSEPHTEQKARIAQEKGASGFVSKLAGPTAMILSIRKALEQ